MKSTSERLFTFDLVSGPALEAKKPQVIFFESIDTVNLEVPSYQNLKTGFKFFWYFYCFDQVLSKEMVFGSFACINKRWKNPKKEELSLFSIFRSDVTS